MWIYVDISLSIRKFRVLHKFSQRFAHTKADPSEKKPSKCSTFWPSDKVFKQGRGCWSSREGGGGGREGTVVRNRRIFGFISLRKKAKEKFFPYNPPISEAGRILGEASIGKRKWKPHGTTSPFWFDNRLEWCFIQYNWLIKNANTFLPRASDNNYVLGWSLLLKRK